jgi:hypothetical protein
LQLLSIRFRLSQFFILGGAQLVAFGETWLPGYPACLDVCPGAALWENAFAKDIFAMLRSNSIAIPGDEVKALLTKPYGFAVLRPTQRQLLSPSTMVM